jgi:DNA (cytosine-5)-methyltransferase 1
MKKKSYPTCTDIFCGAGGSSQGAINSGCEVRMAMNHWPLAVETHSTNFPRTDHDCADISGSDPRRYPSTDILVASPECTNHSLSKGKKRKNLGQLDLFNPQIVNPGEERSRCTMWDVVRFSECHSYNLVIVENVVEVKYWELFDAWLTAMQTLGYDHEEVYFNSMFAPPTPQSRDRLYVVFWKKGNRKPDLNITPLAYCAEHGEIEAIQVWKNHYKRWGRYGKRNQYLYHCPQCAAVVEPYYTPAHTAIDWGLPSQRIGDRLRPLKPATLERIQKGLEKFRGPLIVETARTKSAGLVRGVDEMLPTQTTAQSLGLATPFMITLRKNHGAKGVTDPLDTVVAGGTHHGLVQPFLTSYYSSSDQVSGVDAVVPTITTGDRHALVQPFLVNYYTPRISIGGVDEPLATVSTQPRTYIAEPSAAVTVEDCFFRMLQPDEIKRAMAFADDYVVLGNKRERVKLCGNAVTPPVMEMLTRRCIATLS